MQNFFKNIFKDISFLANIYMFGSLPGYLSCALISVFLTKLSEIKVIKELQPLISKQCCNSSLKYRELAMFNIRLSPY